MSVRCKFHMDVVPDQEGATAIRLKCAHTSGHPGDHYLGVNWPLDSWLARLAHDFQRLTITRFPKTEMVPVAMVELNEAA